MSPITLTSVLINERKQTFRARLCADGFVIATCCGPINAPTVRTTNIGLRMRALTTRTPAQLVDLVGRQLEAHRSAKRLRSATRSHLVYFPDGPPTSPSALATPALRRLGRQTVLEAARMVRKARPGAAIINLASPDELLAIVTHAISAETFNGRA